MNMPDASKQILAIVESLLLIGERALAIVRSLNLIKARTVPYSYENLLLEFNLDLKDPQGRRALLTRKQRVHFFTAEAGVLSSPVWGEGTQLRRFELTGATRLGARPDGSRQVLMLGLHRPAVSPDGLWRAGTQAGDSSGPSRVRFRPATPPRPQGR